MHSPKSYIDFTVTLQSILKQTEYSLIQNIKLCSNKTLILLQNSIRIIITNSFIYIYLQISSMENI